MKANLRIVTMWPQYPAPNWPKFALRILNDEFGEHMDPKEEDQDTRA